jgi:hypothetical protein
VFEAVETGVRTRGAVSADKDFWVSSTKSA